MASLYEIGEGAWVRASFANPTTGAAMDPSIVAVRVLPPSFPEGAPTSYIYGTDVEVVKDAVGEYSILLTLDEVGLWQYRWEGENVAPAIQEGTLIVRRSDLV